MRTRTEPAAEEVAPPPEGRTLGLLRAFARLLLRQPPRLYWLAPVGWAALIWGMSSFSISVAAGRGGHVAFLGNLVHAFEFGVLALLLVPLAPRAHEWVVLDRHSVGAIAGVAVGYGILDEIHQAFVHGRHSSAFDVLTDSVGVFCTLKVVLYVSDHEATGRGLWGRLAWGLGLCMIAAGFATLSSL